MIKHKDFLNLEDFTKIDSQKEVCALIFANSNDDVYTVTNIVQVRNIKRGAFSFAIANKDFEYYRTKDLIGIYHSHPNKPLLSNKDMAIFLKHPDIKFQIIGFYKKNKFNLKCYSNKLKQLKINIL